MLYDYCILNRRQWIATLNKGDDSPLKKIGTFKTEKDARAKCEAHHAKACKAARNFGRPEPRAIYR